MGNQVTLTLINSGNRKLAMIKGIKMIFPNMGLKECKDYVDETSYFKPDKKLIGSATNEQIREFKRYLAENCPDAIYRINDIESKRATKMIELGLSTRPELIEVLSNRLVDEIAVLVGSGNLDALLDKMKPYIDSHFINKSNSELEEIILNKDESNS
jgi:hypothetical protein